MTSNMPPWLPGVFGDYGVVRHRHPHRPASLRQKYVPNKTRSAGPANANSFPEAAAKGSGRDAHTRRGPPALQTDAGRVGTCGVLLFSAGAQRGPIAVADSDDGCSSTAGGMPTAILSRRNTWPHCFIKPARAPAERQHKCTALALPAGKFAPR